MNRGPVDPNMLYSLSLGPLVLGNLLVGMQERISRAHKENVLGELRLLSLGLRAERFRVYRVQALSLKALILGAGKP